MVFHWSLSDSKSAQVTRTLLSIVAILNNVVVWMASTRPPSSKSSCPFNEPLVTVPKGPIMISIIVTFMFHSLSVPSQGRRTYLYFSPKSFVFSCIRLLVCFHVIFSQFLVEFSFVVLKYPVLSVVLHSVDISFWFIVSSYIVIFVCVCVCYVLLFVFTCFSIFPVFYYLVLFS